MTLPRISQGRGQGPEYREPCLFVRAQNEAKDAQISSLYEDIANKDRGFENLFAKIDDGLK